MDHSSYIIEDYHGNSYTVEKPDNRKLVVFIVDDSESYLGLLKIKLTNQGFDVHAFSTGEECLDYLVLKPDLIILDYHLDGVNPGARKGDLIKKEIEEILPSTDVIVISSDNKLDLLNLSSTAHETLRIMRKDGFTVENLVMRGNKLLLERQVSNMIHWKMLLSISIFSLLMWLAMVGLNKVFFQ